MHNNKNNNDNCSRRCTFVEYLQIIWLWWWNHRRRRLSKTKSLDFFTFSLSLGNSSILNTFLLFPFLFNFLAGHTTPLATDRYYIIFTAATAAAAHGAKHSFAAADAPFWRFPFQFQKKHNTRSFRVSQTELLPLSHRTHSSAVFPAFTIYQLPCSPIQRPSRITTGQRDENNINIKQITLTSSAAAS